MKWNSLKKYMAEDFKSRDVDFKVGNSVEWIGSSTDREHEFGEITEVLGVDTYIVKWDPGVGRTELVYGEELRKA